jgi:molybdopterin/thiamine biosynthesis adenylyltransferase
MNQVRSIRVIGCGGIGGHLAPNLCRFLHAGRDGVHVTLVDGDTFEERNRTRMRITGLGNKALVLARDLAAEFGDVLTIEPVPEYVTRKNVDGIIQTGDLVFLAVDNHRTRHLVDLHCATLPDIALISGGNDGVEAGARGTFGNVQLVHRRGGRPLTNTLGRFHPEIREPDDRSPAELGCTELAAAGAPQLLFTNFAVASAMLNTFYGWLQQEVAYEEVYLDILRNRVLPTERAVE